MAEGKTLMEILGGSPFSKPSERPYDARSVAIIARGKYGGTVVCAKPNSALYWEIHDVGSSNLEDFGLDSAPDGISIWEGIAVWRPGGWEYPQDGQTDFEGEFRRPNAEELTKMAAGEPLWPEPPEGDDVNENESSAIEGDVPPVRDAPGH